MPSPPGFKHWLTRGRKGWWKLATLAVVLVLGGWVALQPTRQEPMGDIFRLLEAQGFVANTGLSGTFAPGNVIQTREPGPNGGRPLPSPIVFLWGSDCFPGQVPRTSNFVLPDSTERRTGSLSISAEVLEQFLPSLALDRAVAADYTLTLGKTLVHTFAKADLSRRFSEKCVQALAQAMEDGDRIEWFSVILEAVVADSLALVISWREGASVAARTAQREAAESQLGGILSAAAVEQDPFDATVDVVSDTDKSSVLRSDAPVIVGYRARPMQPVHGG